MDAEITTLTATLDAIKRIHSKPSHPPRPFTSAILNTYKLDVLDFIRDADQFEANLFWYPPTGSALAGPSSSSKPPPDISIAPRLPEPKVFVPPTPLRKNVKEAEARGLVEFDARTLLKAAQRLLDNYHSAPRARKHIKSLLRKHADVQRSIREMEELVKQNDEVISQMQSQGTELTQSLRLSRSRLVEEADVDEKEAERLQKSIQREEMEMLAIEQMMEDLLLRNAKPVSPQKMPKEAETSNQRTPRRSAGRVGAVSRTPKASSSRGVMPSAEQPKTPTSKPTSRKSNTPNSRHSLAESANALADETIRIQHPATGEVADETIRLHPIRLSDAQESALPVKEEERLHPESKPIQSSDELERICENIWAIFGDHLRFAAPEKESGDLHETLEALFNVSMCRPGGSPSSSARADGDASIASSASNTTAATSGSSVTSGASLISAGPPLPSISIASRILITLLNSVPPHSIDFDEVKKQTDAWWNDVGRNAYIAALGQEAGVDVPLSGLSGNTPASKATYDLVAKKLLRIRFAGKQRIVSFPANIL